MLSLEERKELIRKNIKSEAWPPVSRGGQQVGLGPSGIKLTSEDLDIEIIISHHRSRLKNHELAMTLMELAIDDLIKP